MHRQAFLEGMSRAACTVSIVTTDGSSGRAGVTVSAMTSVSADTPEPTLLVCVHHQSAAAQAIATNGVFCVNVLRDEHSIISDVFAGRTRTASGNKFDCAQWLTLKTGAPALVDSIVAFDCRLMQQFRFGTHWVFVGLLEDIVISHPGTPLVYANRAYGVPVPMEQARSKSIVHRGTSSPMAAIDIGYYITLGASFLPAVLGGFRAENPRSQVTILEGDQDRLKSALRNRDIELAFTYDLELGDEYEKILLGEAPPYVLLPAGHPLCRQTRISLESLVEEPMVLLDVAPSRDYFCSLFATIGKAPYVEHRSRSFEMVRGMVGHGFGYALLATKPSNNMTYDGMLLTTRPLLEHVASSRFVICHSKAPSLSASARGFIDFCEEFFQFPQSLG
jgi:flavin reductase (DIM6/NTAB) family NADH-FMN oxidoreductase RutF/DNA-binding transcriptional LysR family regulator